MLISAAQKSPFGCAEPLDCVKQITEVSLV